MYTKKTVARPQTKTGLFRIVVKTKLETYVQYIHRTTSCQSPRARRRAADTFSLRLRPKRKTGRQKIATNTIIISSREGLKPVISFSSHTSFTEYIVQRRVHCPRTLGVHVPFRSLLQILIYSEK